MNISANLECFNPSADVAKDNTVPKYKDAEFESSMLPSSTRRKWVVAETQEQKDAALSALRADLRKLPYNCGSSRISIPENMSKQTERKITVETTLNENRDSQRKPSIYEGLGANATSSTSTNRSNNENRDSQRRPSVFERLATKATFSTGTNQRNNDSFCRHWAQNGHCPYGENCRYANTQTLIRPSKQRAAKKKGDRQ